MSHISVDVIHEMFIATFHSTMPENLEWCAQCGILFGSPHAHGSFFGLHFHGVWA